MNNPEFTVSLLRDTLSYDPATGLFRWKIKTCRKVVPGVIAGSKNPSGYILIRINRVTYRAHRLAWLYMTGCWPVFDIDHVDGDPSNNRFENLRNVTTAMNIQNQKVAHSRNRTGGYLGVSIEPGCNVWRARICINGVHVNLGWFSTPEEAHQAYLEAKRVHHLTCTI